MLEITAIGIHAFPGEPLLWDLIEWFSLGSELE